MPNPLQKLFVPLYNVAHRPDQARYAQDNRQSMLDRLEAACDLSNLHTVVELGCGNGRITHWWAQRAQRVIGFDINPNRIESLQRDNMLLVAGSAECPPVRDQVADVVCSFAVLEHIRDRIDTLNQLKRLMKPDGRMIHFVPTATMKVMQWGGFIPDVLRKEFRGLTRALAGQRKQKAHKHYEGRETNNPYRESRRRWYQKLYPRVHGEYDSNWEEFLQNRRSHWRREFESAGLRVVQQISAGLISPYAFGISRAMGRFHWTGLSCVTAFVLELDGAKSSS